MDIAVVLVFWFLTSTGFNDFTPRLMTSLISAGGNPVDLTLIELFVTILIAGTKLWFQGQRILPSMDMLRRVLFIGGLHLTGCRFFVYSLSLGVPVSLAQTIRAMNPLFAVMIGVCVGERYQRAVLLSLIPIVVGFGLAVSADLDVEPIGVAASIGSVLCLACVNFLSKAVNDDPKQEVTSSELQCWLCVAALVWLIPFWAYGGGMPRLAGAFETSGVHLVLLCIVDGAFYFSEQIAQFTAIAALAPLTLAVTDTVRRLFIVVMAGFVLQGNPCSIWNVAGACLVCAGAGYYARLQTFTQGVTKSGKKDA